MSGILNIKLESIQDELTGIEYGGNLNILPNYSKLPAFFAQLSGAVTDFKLREFAIRNSEYIHIKDVAITGNIEVEGYFIKYVGSTISVDDALNYNAKIFDYYFNLDGVAYKSSKFIISDLEVPSLVTLRVIDPHSDVQEYVKVYESGSLLGETDVNGEIEVVSGSNLILGKSGFFIKSYVSTESKNQDVTLNYVVPTVKIGTQVWQSENLAVDDLQGGVKYPNGDINNVADYGLIYLNPRAVIVSNLMPCFRQQNSSDVSIFRNEVDVSNAGNLKETGTLYWNSPNTGATNALLFNARGAGAFLGGAYIWFREYFVWVHEGGVQAQSQTLKYNDTVLYEAGWDDVSYGSIRLIKASTPDTFIFSISVNSGGSAVQGATVSVEGNDYTTDINGQVFIEEYKTSVNYSVSKTGYDTVNGSIDLTSEFTKIVTLTASSNLVVNLKDDAGTNLFALFSNKFTLTEAAVIGTTLTLSWGVNSETFTWVSSADNSGTQLTSTTDYSTLVTDLNKNTVLADDFLIDNQTTYIRIQGKDALGNSIVKYNRGDGTPQQYHLTVGFSGSAAVFGNIQSNYAVSFELDITGGTPPYEYSLDGGSNWKLNSSFPIITYDEVDGNNQSILVRDSLSDQTTFNVDLDTFNPINVNLLNGEL